MQRVTYVCLSMFMLSGVAHSGLQSPLPVAGITGPIGTVAAASAYLGFHLYRRYTRKDR